MSVDLTATFARHTVARGMRSTPAFASTHLGAHQWGAACGYDPSIEPIDLFARFTADEWPVALDADDVLEQTLQEALLDSAARLLGQSVIDCPLYLHPRYEWCFASPTGLCDDGSIVDIQTMGIALDDEEDVEIETWGPNEGDVPPRVFVHAMGNMTIRRSWLMAHEPELPLTKAAHVVVLSARKHGLAKYRVEWDEDAARRLFDRVARFWACVKTKTPPPQRETEAFYKYLEQRFPKHAPGRWIEADERLRAAVVGHSRVDAQIDELRRERHRMRNEICARIGDAEGVRGVDEKGAFRLPWRWVNGSKPKLNEALLATMLQHLLGADETKRILDTCTKKGSGYRKLGPEHRPKLRSVGDTMKAAMASEDGDGGSDGRRG